MPRVNHNRNLRGTRHLLSANTKPRGPKEKLHASSLARLIWGIGRRVHHILLVQVLACLSCVAVDVCCEEACHRFFCNKTLHEKCQHDRFVSAFAQSIFSTSSV